MGTKIVINPEDFQRPKVIHFEQPDAINETLSVTRSLPEQVKKRAEIKKMNAEAKVRAEKRAKENQKKLEQNPMYQHAVQVVEASKQPRQAEISQARERTPYEIAVQQRRDDIRNARYEEMYNKAFTVTKDPHLARKMALDLRTWGQIESAYKDWMAGAAALTLGAIVAPEYVIPSYVAGKATDFGTFALSDGKYGTFGEFAEKQLGIPEGYGDLINPGYSVGAGMGALATRPGLMAGTRAFGKQFMQDYGIGLGLGAGSLALTSSSLGDDGSNPLTYIGGLATLAGLGYGGYKGYNWVKNKIGSNSATPAATATATATATGATNAGFTPSVSHYSPNYGLFAWEHPSNFRDHAILSSNSKVDLMNEFNQAVSGQKIDEFVNKYQLYKKATDANGVEVQIPWSNSEIIKGINDGSLILNYHNNVLGTGVVGPTFSQRNWMRLRNTGRVATGLGTATGLGYGVYHIIDRLGNEQTVVAAKDADDNPVIDSTDIVSVQEVNLSQPATAEDSAFIEQLYKENGVPLPAGWKK